MSPSDHDIAGYAVSALERRIPFSDFVMQQQTNLEHIFREFSRSENENECNWEKLFQHAKNAHRNTIIYLTKTQIGRDQEEYTRFVTLLDKLSPDTTPRRYDSIITKLYELTYRYIYSAEYVYPRRPSEKIARGGLPNLKSTSTEVPIPHKKSIEFLFAGFLALLAAIASSYVLINNKIDNNMEAVRKEFVNNKNLSQTVEDEIEKSFSNANTLPHSTHQLINGLAAASVNAMIHPVETKIKSCQKNLNELTNELQDLLQVEALRSAPAHKILGQRLSIEQCRGELGYRETGAYTQHLWDSEIIQGSRFFPIRINFPNVRDAKTQSYLARRLRSRVIQFKLIRHDSFLEAQVEQVVFDDSQPNLIATLPKPFFEKIIERKLRKNDVGTLDAELWFLCVRDVSKALHP